MSTAVACLRPELQCAAVRVADGLALEQRLATDVTLGTASGAVHLWRPLDRAMVVPRRLTQEPAFARASEELRQRGYPVLTRASGGDIVPQVPGMLNIAIGYAVAPVRQHGFGVESAYRFLCEPVIDWLREQHLGVSISTGAVAGALCDGRFNVVAEQRKIAGTAQRWGRSKANDDRIVFGHAMLFLDVDIDPLIDAVNTFYRICGIDRCCEASSHVTLRRLRCDARLAGTPGDGLQLVRLYERYSRALRAFNDDFRCATSFAVE